VFKLQEITEFLIGKSRFTQIDSKEYVDWAVRVLENGYDGDNLRILAGLDYSDTIERLEYFNRTLSDLQIQIQADSDEVSINFVHQLANNVINGIETPEKGLRIMEDVVIATDYSSKYLQFMDLAEDIESLIYSGSPLFSAELNNENISKMILNEFNLFLKAESVIDNIRNLSFCKHCNKSMKPSLKKHLSIFKSKRINYYTCSFCGSKDLVHGTSQKGRELIIQNNQ
jgi:hypothetical protein